MSGKREPYEVRGHLCEGLREHFAAATYGCIPRFGDDGQIHGCDDTNGVAIRFCPYCGESLETATPDKAALPPSTPTDGSK